MKSMALSILFFSACAFANSPPIKSEIHSKEKKATFLGDQKRKPQLEMTYEEEEALNVIENSNCKILITTLRQSGLSEVQQLFTRAKSAEDCERMAQPHRHNLFPDQVKKKTVTTKFLK